MTMRRISVLLVAVMMMLTMAVGTAFADHGRFTVCIERKGKSDIEIRNLTKKERNRILDNRANAVRGECDDGGRKNIGQFIADKATKPF